MGNHRAPRGHRRDHSAAPVPGRRKAVKEPTRHPLLKALPSAPVLVGVAALAVSAGGAAAAGDTSPVSQVTRSQGVAAAAGATSLSSVAPTLDRAAIVSRDARRDAAAAAESDRLVAQAEAQAAEQHAELEQLAKSAEQQSAKIKENQWVLPLASYRLTATFGMTSYLWSTVHTGLDFSAPSGSPLHAIAGGVVTSVGYDGSYGNKTVVTLEDGTELWYCHQTSYYVNVGETVRAGDLIGTVGSTGNVTGPHLHLEVRPGGGGPVDPYSALLEHGVHP